MEKSVPSAKKKFSIRDIMTIAAMMVICFIIMMVHVPLPVFPGGRTYCRTLHAW